ncbi:MAG TPA: hypothetical protein VIZ43_23505 [Trebonia sp.]
MPITVTITDESGTGRVAAAMTLDGIAERITVCGTWCPTSASSASRNWPGADP